MSNPLSWLLKELRESIQQLNKWLAEIQDPPLQSLENHAFPMGEQMDAKTNEEEQNAERSTQTARIAFLDADLSQIEPLESLLEEAWSYLKSQEQLIIDETEAIRALQKKIEINQRWIQLYESGGYPLQPPTPYQFNFERNRRYRYGRELTIYQKIHSLRQKKVNQLNSNRVEVSILLDDLRSELLEIDSYRNSIDQRFLSSGQEIAYSDKYLQTRLDTFRQQFEITRRQERQTIDRFNQQLAKLTKVWRTVGSP